MPGEGSGEGGPQKSGAWRLAPGGADRATAAAGCMRAVCGVSAGSAALVHPSSPE